MLLVKTKIGQSKIHGIGLFADQFIKKGTMIWKFQPGFDLKIDKDELSKLSEPAREQFLKYAYLDFATHKYILCFDDSRFFNHSEDPNSLDVVSEDYECSIDVAGRDIEIGEELTCNYLDFDEDFDNKHIGD